MLNKININKYNNFNNLNLENLNNINLFYGDNGTGKSTIINAVHLLNTEKLNDKKCIEYKGKLGSIKGFPNKDKPNIYKLNIDKFIDKDIFKYENLHIKNHVSAEFNTIMNSIHKIINSYSPSKSPIFEIIDNYLKVQKLNFNELSDGSKKILNIIIAVFLEKHNILLIDDIESNIFYKYYQTILFILFDYALKNNNQLFITTQNIEILNTTKKILINHNNFKSKFDFYWLIDTNDICMYNADGFLNNELIETLML